MSKDEARKLIGGYATGSLTEAERKALFEAALADQDIFDELAGEQALKEVLDQPGARQRLLTALEPKAQADRSMWWAWVGAAATLAMVMGVVLYTRTPEAPQQIAQVNKSAEPAAAAQAPAPEPAPPPAVRRKVAPAPTSAASSPPPPPPPPSPAPAAAAPAAAPAAQPAALPPLAIAESREEVAVDKVQVSAAARARTDAAAGRGGAAGQIVNGQPAAAALSALAKAAPEFGFSYSVSQDRFLQMKPEMPGYLSVTAGDAVVFPSTLVGVDSLRIAIPTGASSLVIAFSRSEGTTGTPVRRDQTSGTVTDQDPPNGRIVIQLFLTPAPR